jgi:hypothetical protein
VSEHERDERLEDDPLARQRELERERGLGRGPEEGTDEPPAPPPDDEEEGEQ